MWTVEGKPLHRKLGQSLECLMPDGSFDLIPIDFEWDGSSASVPPYEGRSKLKKFFRAFIAAPINFVARGIFPRFRHPVASCKHDYRCSKAKNKEERRFADCMFEEDVGKTSFWITKKVGYVGVRTGAVLGIGNHY
jgi:hypothetical protein